MPARRLLAALIAIATLTPCVAYAEDRWTLGLSGGVADSYTYQLEGPYENFFEFTWLASVAASYSLGHHLSIQGEATYLRYSKNFLGAAYDDYNDYTLTSSNPHLATGLRVYATGPTSTPARPYIEVLPALYVSTWTEHGDVPGGGTEESFTAIEPGFVAGAGLVGLSQASLRLDIGFRFYYSADIGFKDLGTFSGGDFRGLRQGAVVIGLHKPL